jgi:uncharacterized phage-associated protein
MSATNNIIDIAKYCIYQSNNLDKPLTNLELQILLYRLQQKYAEKYNTPLFFDTIKIKSFPIIENVFYYFCGFGAMPIGFGKSDKQIYDKTKNLSEECCKLVDEILPQYTQMSFFEKTKTYDYETSVYNRIKNKGVKEIEPFDFLTKNS